MLSSAKRKLKISCFFSRMQLLAVFFIASCSSIPETSILKDTQSELTASIAKTSKARDIGIPDEVEDALFTQNSMGSKLSADVRDTARFDVSVNNIPANVFFLSLVADSGVNVVTDPDISGRISLELTNVTVEEVLNVTRDVYGYEYRLAGGIYIIYSRKLRTQVFPINYLDVQRVGVTDTNVSIGEIRSSGGENGGGNNNNENQQDSANLLGYLGGDDQAASGGDGGFSPGARVQTLNKTDFWGKLQLTLSAIIGGDADGRMVMTNPQAGLVVVNAMPRELSAVRRYLDKSKLSVGRQVVLETKILEVRLSKGFEAGVNWGVISGALSASQTTADSKTLDRVLFSAEGTTESVVSSVLNITDITKLLSLLETQGDVKVLSSPRISTVNNQKAIIRVGSDEFFVTGLTSSTVTNAATTTNQPTIELDSFFSGIALDVTPQIAENGDVILHVHPIVTDVRDQQKDIVIGDDTFSLPLALRDVRESDSIVKARNGQIVVLGGLMQETTSTEGSKRPGLGDIPILRSLFRTKQQASYKTELVILMRPMVIDDDDWSEELGARKTSLEWFSDKEKKW